ncbi:MAG: FtsX-like permease family protein [Proteobacteria bacterium]|nr:FtsX-like permease family protein [Pseudomonadota bacterium]
MKTLDRKLFRELWMIKGQVLAIVLVIASGLSTVIMSYSTLSSLQQTRERYYLEYGFADLFVSLKRAPVSLLDRIEKIAGISQANQLIKASIRIELENYNGSIQGQLVSLNPPEIKKRLNQIYLREGRMPEKGNSKEVLISEAFAQAHQLHPGAQMMMIVNGKKSQLDIVGIALSPETIYQIAPGTIIPDFSRYAIVWIPYKELETIYDMKSAFNELSVKLMNDVRSELIIQQLDQLLKPYGGLGTYAREQHTSHHFLSEEFKQLENMGSSFSIIFLGVSVFLLNMVLGRLIDSQRDIIATLKAFGYSNLLIVIHYSKLILIITAIGIVLGVIAGVFLGHNLANLYMEYYRLPYLDYNLQDQVVFYSSLTTIIAALSGSWFSINKALKLQPAEAMRPEVPMQYSISIIERLGLKQYLSPPMRMILRYFSRHPIKSFLTVFGTSFAVAIMIVGTFFIDAMDNMIESEFKLSQREDLNIALLNPTSKKVLYELANISGVMHVEAYRVAAVKILAGSKNFRTSIYGYEKTDYKKDGYDDNRVLHRLLDIQNQPIRIPEKGILLSSFLAEKLSVKTGDWIMIEFLQDKRTQKTVQIVGLSNQYIGLSAYMDIGQLNDLMEEGDLISGAYLSIENGSLQKTQMLLNQLPQIAAINEKNTTIESFKKTIGEFMLIYISFVSALSLAIAFGVIYNNARITLSERSRELASLRVLGYTKEEVANILLGELALMTVLAIPLGLLMGYWMSYAFIMDIQQELFRIPLVINLSTYALAIVVVCSSAIISGLIVRHKLNQINLVNVLKIKE